MKALLVIETNKGFAVAPYAGPVPENFVESMSVATKLSSYSYGDTVQQALEDYFRPPEPVELKVAA